MASIKVKTFALIRRKKEVLLEEIKEQDGTLVGYRPLGGSIEFGELSHHALEREFIEELGEDIKIRTLYCVAEEIFTYNDAPGHEVNFIYEAEFINKKAYDEDMLERMDSTHGILVHAHWLNPLNLPNGLPLFPAELWRKLKQE